ncbi:hypothetical protein ABT072_08375 [Streptomyces sp. NPDC002589]|uniref:hypothetical protein n=1 Tax=Streptomyces sp. NPDC002589 TaxID=3154420 RepID=UPI00331D79B6
MQPNPIADRQRACTHPRETVTEPWVFCADCGLTTNLDCDHRSQHYTSSGWILCHDCGQSHPTGQDD